MALTNEVGWMRVGVELMAERLWQRARALLITRVRPVAPGARETVPIPTFSSTQNVPAGGSLAGLANDDKVLRNTILDPSEDVAGNWVATRPVPISDAEIARLGTGTLPLILEGMVDQIGQTVDERVMSVAAGGAGGFVGGNADAASPLTVGNFASATALDRVAGVRQALSEQSVNFMDTVRMVINDRSYRVLLGTEGVVRADARGTDATIRTGFINGLSGFDAILDSQNTAHHAARSGARAVNNAGGYAKGYEGAITVDGAQAGTALSPGDAVRFGTQPHAYVVRSAAANSVTLTVALIEAISDNDALTYQSAAFAGGVAAKDGCIITAVRMMEQGERRNRFSVVSTHPSGLQVRLTQVGQDLADLYLADILFDVQVVQPLGVVAIGFSQ